MPSKFHNFTLTLIALMLAACSEPCQPPGINFEQLRGFKAAAFSSGPVGALVLPNPMEATQNNAATASSADTLQAFKGFRLPSLLNPQILESDLVKIRIRGLNDALSSLAQPASDGRYAFPVSSPHYSEVLAYHSVESMRQYIQALGFSLVKTRPLFVFVRAAGSTSNPEDANAYYDHHYLDPNSPRTMHIFGEGDFAPGEDRDIYWHEFGHFVNESVSGESGIDFAGDNGAHFTQAAALHECLADYLAESASDKAYIGKWLARNFSDIPKGNPLRSASDTTKHMVLDDVILTRNNTLPGRYTVGEWCTRVLWDIRMQFIARFGDKGAELSDRLVYGAVSQLGKDTSFRQFKDKLIASDQKQFCGENSTGITNVFASRGFVETPPKAGNPLSLSATPVSLSYSSGQAIASQPKSGSPLAFSFTLQNTNTLTVRNVRLILESMSSNLTTSTYLQGMGDLPAGGSVQVGSTGLPFDLSVTGEIASGLPAGTKVKFRLRVTSENAPDTVQESEITL